MFKKQSGLSAVSLIIILVVVAALGVGGYFGYTNFLAPMMNPYAKIIPEGLKQYAAGADADAFVIYKKDAELESQLKKLPAEALIANSVNSALILIKGSPESVAGYVEFTSENEANLAKKFLDENQAKSGTKDPVKIDLKKDVLVLTYGQGETAFQGKLQDNPHISMIDKERLADQLIMYVDITKVPQSLSSISGFSPSLTSFLNRNNSLNLLKTAHAQTGFISTTDSPEKIVSTSNANPSPAPSGAIAAFMKESIVYVRLKEGVLSSKVIVNILPKTQISESVVMKMGMSEVPIAEIEKVYDSALADFTKSVPDMNRATGFVKMFAPSVNITMALNELTFTVDISSPLQDLVDLAVKQNVVEDSGLFGPPKGALDSAKKMALNDIIIAVEQYRAASNAGNYPDKSACIDQMTDLAQYFKNGLPADKQGEKSFGDIKCPGGYYYQYFPEKSSYTVWAKMESAKDGNFALTPAEFEEAAKKGQPIEQVEEGDYYIVDETGYSSRPASSQSGFFTLTTDSETDKPVETKNADTTLSDSEITTPEIAPPVEVINPVTPKVRRPKTP